MNHNADDGAAQTPSGGEKPPLYATLGPRAAASLLDSLIIVPVLLLSGFIDAFYPRLCPWACVSMLVLVMGYFVYCHGIWGQTLGKWVVAIQLRQNAGGPATWRNAWLRSSVDILTVVTGLVCAALLALTEGNVEAAGILGMVAAGANLANLTWWAAKILVHLRDKRRRAVHDLLAGTVVVQLEKSRASRRVAWVLVPGILLTVLLAIAPIAIPNWRRAQEAALLNQIRVNLLLIHNAKEVWALEAHKDPGAEPTKDELEPHFATHKFPSSVAGETYEIHAVGIPATARLGSKLLDYPPGALVESPPGFPGSEARLGSGGI